MKKQITICDICEKGIYYTESITENKVSLVITKQIRGENHVAKINEDDICDECAKEIYNKIIEIKNSHQNQRQ